MCGKLSKVRSDRKACKPELLVIYIYIQQLIAGKYSTIVRVAVKKAIQSERNSYFESPRHRANCLDIVSNQERQIRTRDFLRRSLTIQLVGVVRRTQHHVHCRSARVRLSQQEACHGILEPWLRCEELDELPAAQVIRSSLLRYPGLFIASFSMTGKTSQGVLPCFSEA